ncbi:50S ribosomal protein L29 [Candidatus Parcubacteria bacterium]|nr:50S ribosomal protein L29 [Candidatus Parcubacteria bacterium]
MAKKKLNLKDNTPADLHKLVADKQEELRALRFNVAGSKTRNVKLARTLRKEVARALTELNTRN